MDDLTNKTYCRVPFDAVTVSPTGRMSLCCQAEWTVEKTSLNDLNSIQDWFTGDYLKNVRTSMLKGEKIPECEKCYKRERLHGKSKRTHDNETYFKHNDDHLEHSIKKIDLSLGNKCNLKCKMCFPYQSSELWKEWKALGWNSKEKDPNSDTSWRYYDGYYEEEYSWPKKKSNMDKIKEVSEGLERLSVVGGEPMINPEFYELLDHLIRVDKAKDITLDVITNGTKVHPRFFGMASKFKELRLSISMDGVDSTYDYVRYPANFEKVYANIKRYSDYVKTLGGNSRLSFGFVLQIWNLHNAIDVIKKLTPLAVNEPIAPVRIEELHDPRFMHWSILPLHKIKEVVKQITVEKSRPNDKATKWGIIGLYRVLKAYRQYRKEDRSILLSRLKEFTDKQDTYRKINLGDYIPELKDIVK